MKSLTLPHSLICMATLFLFACSSQNKGQTAFGVNESVLPLQLDEHEWKLEKNEGQNYYVNTKGTRIVVSQEAAPSENPETRVGLLTETYGETTRSLGPKWEKSSPQVLSINKQIGTLPTPNLIWSISKNGQEMAGILFYKNGQVYSILIESTAKAIHNQLGEIFAATATN